jgi:hypothetical protein
MTISYLALFGLRRDLQPPDCVACGERMQLADVTPHERFTQLDTHRYGCACGRISEEAVAREA